MDISIIVKQNFKKTDMEMIFIRKAQEQLLFNAVKNAANEETAKIVVFGRDYSHSEDNPTWVKNTMQRLETHFDPDAILTIRRNCQCGYAMDEKLKLLKDLINSSNSIEEFANQNLAKANGLSFKDGELYLQFSFCPCPMLAEVDKLESNSWCQCTTGYSKVLFEKAFSCKVEVELLKSIKMGDENCVMKIIPLELDWEKL